MRKRRITRAEYPIIPEIEIKLFLHRCFNIDFGQYAKALGLERLDDAFHRSEEAPAHGLGDIIFHMKTSTELGGRRNFRATMRVVRYCVGGRQQRQYRERPARAQAHRSLR